MMRNHNLLQIQENVHGVGLIATEFASHARMMLQKNIIPPLHLNASKGKVVVGNASKCGMVMKIILVLVKMKCHR
jgi:hypothetical protein